MKKVEWNDARIELLKKLWLSGKSASEIVERFQKQFGDDNMTRSMVLGKANRLGLKRKGSAHERTKSNKGNKGGRSPNFFGMDHVPRRKPMPFRDLKFDDYDADVKGILPDDLGYDHCRWPIGDPKLDSFLYCGEDRVQGRSYCQHHLGRAYRKRVGGIWSKWNA